ncbi:MAG: AAA family ATPase [Clostridium sp.]
MYRLDFATVQGKYVGQSGQQLRDALTTAENVSPCILWIDEIEKDYQEQW